MTTDRTDLVRRLRERIRGLSELVDALEVQPEPAAPTGPRLHEEPPAWPERLWTVPPETLLRVPDVAAALQRSTSWVYKRTYKGAANPLPAERLGADLVFRAGEIRDWVEATLGRGDAA